MATFASLPDEVHLSICQEAFKSIQVLLTYCLLSQRCHRIGSALLYEHVDRGQNKVQQVQFCTTVIANPQLAALVKKLTFHDVKSFSLDTQILDYLQIHLVGLVGESHMTRQYPTWDEICMDEGLFGAIILEAMLRNLVNLEVLTLEWQSLSKLNFAYLSTDGNLFPTIWRVNLSVLDHPVIKKRIKLDEFLTLLALLRPHTVAVTGWFFFPLVSKPEVITLELDEQEWYGRDHGAAPGFSHQCYGSPEDFPSVEALALLGCDMPEDRLTLFLGAFQNLQRYKHSFDPYVENPIFPEAVVRAVKNSRRPEIRLDYTRAMDVDGGILDIHLRWAPEI